MQKQSHQVGIKLILHSDIIFLHINTNVINVEQLDGSRPASGPKYLDMTQRNEASLVDARRAFYENAEVQVHLLEYGEMAGWEAEYFSILEGFI